MHFPIEPTVYNSKSYLEVLYKLKNKYLALHEKYVELNEKYAEIADIAESYESLSKDYSALVSKYAELAAIVENLLSGLGSNSAEKVIAQAETVIASLLTSYNVYDNLSGILLNDGYWLPTGYDSYAGLKKGLDTLYAAGVTRFILLYNNFNSTCTYDGTCLYADINFAAYSYDGILYVGNTVKCNSSTAVMTGGTMYYLYSTETSEFTSYTVTTMLNTSALIPYIEYTEE